MNAVHTFSISLLIVVATGTAAITSTNHYPAEFSVAWEQASTTTYSKPSNLIPAHQALMREHQALLHTHHAMSHRLHTLYAELARLCRENRFLRATL